MNNLCEKCGKNPWAAPVFLGSKPTEQWCDNCIQTEIDAGVNVTVLGDYFQIKKEKEVMVLIDKLKDMLTIQECDNTIDYGGYYVCGYAKDRIACLSLIKNKLTEMWGE